MEVLASLLREADRASEEALAAEGAYPSDAGERVAAIHELIVAIAKYVDEPRALYALVKLAPPQTVGQKLVVDALWLIMCQRKYTFLPTDWQDRCGRIRAAMIARRLSVGQFWQRAFFLLSGVARAGLLHSLVWLTRNGAFPPREVETVVGAWYVNAVEKGTALDIALGTIPMKDAPSLQLVPHEVQTREDLVALFPDATFKRYRSDTNRYLMATDGDYKFVWTKGGDSVLLVHVPFNRGLFFGFAAVKEGFFEDRLERMFETTRGLEVFFDAMYGTQESLSEALFAALQLPDKTEKPVLYRVPMPATTSSVSLE